MKRTIFALAFLPSVALAQEPPTTIRAAGESSTLPANITGEWEAVGDVDTYRVYLTRGVDYAFGVDPYPDGNSAGWTVKGPTGTVLCTFSANENHDGGCERRAGATGWFSMVGSVNDFSENTYPASYKVRVAADCRNSIKTRCTIAPGQSIARTFDYGADGDAFKLRNLVGGRRYTVTLDASHGPSLAVLDGTGKMVLELPSAGGSFRASSTTRYLQLKAEDELGPQVYHLSLR